MLPDYIYQKWDKSSRTSQYHVEYVEYVTGFFTFFSARIGPSTEVHPISSMEESPHPAATAQNRSETN
jgi:hypothetical protein